MLVKPAAQITAMARPTRVAFIVEDGDGVHGWLDAVFAASFGCHGGRQFLVVPLINGVIPGLYLEWLKVIDPDIVYLITGDNTRTAELINCYCSPLLMEPVKRFLAAGERQPRLPLGNRALTSLSWLPFLKITSGGFRARPDAILDCYPLWRDDGGLVTDNFGTLYHSFNSFPLHRQLSDIVKPLMLTPPNPPEDRWRMGIKADEIPDGYAALDALATPGRAITIAYLSNIKSKHVHGRSHRWTDSFCLVVGDSFIDRVSCWNAGLLFEDAEHQAYRTLRVPGSVLADAGKAERIKKFLNHNNWIHSYGSTPQVTVRSFSVSEERLQEFANQLSGDGSWNNYRVKALGSVVECCPPTNTRDFVWMPSRRDDDAEVQIPLRHQTELVPVPKPFHLLHAPLAHPICSMGKWMGQYTIHRTADNNRYANVRDVWCLPKRDQLVRLFVQDVDARITANGSLSVPVDMNVKQVQVNEPRDEDFFRSLLHAPNSYAHPDIRYRERMDVPYRYSKASDKGRYLQGVIGMFGSVHRAYEVLTHGFWRRQFAKLSNPSEEQYPRYVRTLQKRFPPQGGVYEFKTPEQWEKLARVLVSQAMNVRQPKYTVTLRRLQEEWQLELERALAANPNLNKRREEILGDAPHELTGSLENLCREGVFHQGYSWSCRHCAYRNWTALSALRMTLPCDVCREEHNTPIDLAFEFRMNEFLATCLREHDTLSVIWALGKLSEEASSFIFSPQTELFRKWPEDQGGVPDLEIDVICVVDGRIVIGEVKASLSEIDRQEIDSLVAVAHEYHPDILVIGAMDGDQAKLDQRLEEVKARVNGAIEVRGLLGEKASRPEFHLP